MTSDAIPTPPAPEAASSSQDYWEPYYRDGQSRWSGRPNRSLVGEATGLAPGTALDLGCGQGGDAIWLAGRGWTVTAADVSASALAVAAEHAASAGVAASITWERHDLAATFPAGRFDLVAATYLHSPVALPRAQILRAAAAAVAPDGTLLVIGHAPSPSHPHVALPGLDEVLAELALADADWTVQTSELRTIEHAFHGEEAHERVDVVVRARRGA